MIKNSRLTRPPRPAAASVPHPKPPERETRIHLERQIVGLMKGIEAYGFITPAIIDADGRIVCGVGRVEAARRLGMLSVPVLRVTHLSCAKLKAFRIFENRIAQDAKWDVAELKLEFEEILAIEPGYTLADLTGFTVGEIDVVLDGAAAADRADADSIVPQRVTGSRIGDLWVIGRHKLLCGNARLAGSYTLLLQGETVHQIISDGRMPARAVGALSPLSSPGDAKPPACNGAERWRSFADF